MFYEHARGEHDETKLLVRMQQGRKELKRPHINDWETMRRISK